MKVFLITIIPLLISFLVTAIVHPALVNFAIAKGILDNPNSRKIQLRPVPVLGGMAIFIGIMAGLVGVSFVVDISSIFVVFCCMVMMMFVGIMDDVMDISPKVRLFCEITLVLVLIFIAHISLGNFHGLWGISQLPRVINAIFTVFAVVGIINSLNLIDGVDGLFSIFCMTTCAIFAYIFYHAADARFYTLSLSAIGALVPFLLHNAFGEKSKMFVGDGGSLFLGIMLSTFVMEITTNNAYSTTFAVHNLGVVPFLLAVLAMPVFDTIRVMTIRISKGISPFTADKRHFHHMLIGLGIAHIYTALTITFINCVIVLCWWISARMGADVNLQFLIVIALASLFNFGTYGLVAYLDERIPEKMQKYREWNIAHRPNRKMFDLAKKIVDSF